MIKIINLKWTGVVLLQIMIGILLVFFPYWVACLSIILAIITILNIRFTWWAYLFFFLMPSIGDRMPHLVNKAILGSRGVVEGLPLGLLVSVVAVIFLLYRKLAGIHKDTMGKSPLLIPIFLLVAYSLLTIAWSPASLGISIWYFLHVIINICFYYFLFRVVDNKDLHRKLMWCLIFAGVILSSQVLTGVFLQTSLNASFDISDVYKIELIKWSTESKEFVFSGLFLGVASTSLMLNIINYIAVGLLLTEKKMGNKCFLLITLAFSFLAVLLTGNKGGLFSFVIAMYLYLILSKKLRKKYLRNGLIVTVAMLTIFISLVAVKRAENTSKTIRVANVSTEQGSSIAYRIQYWKEGFIQLRKRNLTLFGLGIGGYKYTNSLHILHPHNLYLAMFFDFGLMGIIIICAFIFVFMKMFLKLINYQETYLQNMSVALAVALISIAIDGLVFIPYYMFTLWFGLALVFLTFRLAEKELMEDKSINNVTQIG